MQRHSVASTFVVALVIAGTGLWFQSAQADSNVGEIDTAELHVVDCLLPGQIRQLGRRTFLAPRRPIRTTAADCRIRGGEYVAYDRADYKTALRVWLASAEAGDPEAQTIVGEIFERGLGQEPNYEAAIVWYEKAAKAGYARAQFNLGTMYEQGLGVQADKVTALNWYRQAWGIPEDNVMFASAADREQDNLREDLQRDINRKDQQITLLQRQLDDLRARLSEENASKVQFENEIQTLRDLLEDLQDQRNEQGNQLATLARTREPSQGTVSAAQDVAPQPVSVGDLELGSYFALLIANAEYSSMDNLATPLNDINRARKVLSEKYGFTVFTVEDGDNVSIMQAINNLNEVVSEEDNLLLFYAGHGSRLRAGHSEMGYWLPTNAEPPPRNTFWVSNEFVTGHLSRIRAKRVLVVADSCYAGLLSTEPSFLLASDDRNVNIDEEFLAFKMKKRSRLLLSSGGDKPVLDDDGGGHSVFARAFLDELEKNTNLLTGPQLFARIRSKVEASAERLQIDQTPEFKAIKAAGHEVGDFFFVPTELN